MVETKEKKLLTKAQILQGRNAVHHEFIKVLGGEIALRSLTDGQWAEIEAIQARGGKVRVVKPVTGADGSIDMAASELDVVIDLEGAAKAEHEADAWAVKYAMADGEVWTLEEVQGLRPAGVVREIAERVYELSGVRKRRLDEARRFRSK